jgi:hypothetical protein
MHRISTERRGARILGSIIPLASGGIKIIHIWPEKCKRKIAFLKNFSETGRMIDTSFE